MVTGPARLTLQQRIGHLDVRSVGVTMLAGATLALGFIELLRSPLQQLSTDTIQVLAVRTLLFLGPLAVTLLQVLQVGPLCIAAGGDAPASPGSPLRDWRRHAPDLLGGGLACVLLLPYFLAAVLITAVLSLSQGDTVVGLRFLLGSLEPDRFVMALVRAFAFGAIAALICRIQAARGGRDPLAMALRMSRTLLQVTAVLFGLDLVWVLSVDPLRVVGG